tara:strand:- start:1354 stop:1803 length:450 start_codon:yes stop_codon:yes gene_type:complete
MAGYVKTKSTSDGGSTLKQSEQAITIPTGGTANRTAAPVAGEFRFNTDLSKMEFYDGSAFKTIPFQGTSAITQDSFTGDGSTVAFTMSTTVTSNQEQRVVVAVGNVFQNPASAYTVSGTTITFTSPPGDSEPIVVIHGLDSNSATTSVP